MHNAQDVDSLWKQKMQHLENGHEQITYLLNLNENAYDHGDNDVVSHREVVVKLCQLRKIIAEQQLYLTNKKEDITSLKAEMILVPKEQHKEMATLLLSSFTDHFIDQKYCENVGKKLKLQSTQTALATKSPGNAILPLNIKALTGR